MRIIKKSLYVLFYLTGITHVSFAGNNTCSLNGQWWDVHSGNQLPIFLKQDGPKISASHPLRDPMCGPIEINGVSNNISFFFEYTFSKPSEKEMCKRSTYVSGKFNTTNCAIVEGTIETHVVIDNIPHDSITPFKWYKNIVKITAPDVDKVLIITDEPSMPTFRAEAALERPDDFALLNASEKMKAAEAPFTWSINFQHQLTPARKLFDRLPEIATYDPSFVPNFNLLEGIRGGILTFSVEYYKSMRDQKTYIVKGTNPGKDAIESILNDTISRHVACQESQYQQFVAEREGGIGFPNVGKDQRTNQRIGGVGIMQLYKKTTATQVWNWKENLIEGLNRLDKFRIEAKNAHIKEQERLNDDREELGLPSCPKGIPTPLEPDQVIRETIRRYNCGVEYRWEPRNAPLCAGHWVVYHSCKGGDDDGADLGYVDKVMKCKI